MAMPLYILVVSTNSGVILTMVVVMITPYHCNEVSSQALYQISHAAVLSTKP